MCADPPQKFPIVLIVRSQKNIMPVQIYLHISLHALWLSPNSPSLFSFASPSCFFFFKSLSVSSCLSSWWCDTNKRVREREKKKKAVTAVKASKRIAGQLHEKQTSTTHDSSSNSSTWAFTTMYTVKGRDEERLQMTLHVVCLCYRAQREGGQMVKWGLRETERERVIHRHKCQHIRRREET